MKNKAVGILLTLFGFIWLLGNMNLVNGDFTLIIIGVGFLTAYFFSSKDASARNLGFLIPGCITLMIGSFALIESNFRLGVLDGSLFFIILLGIAFWMIYFIHTYRFYPKGSGGRNWPMYTGLALYGFGGMILMIRLFNFHFFRVILVNFWPIALIATGLWILISMSRGTNYPPDSSIFFALLSPIQPSITTYY